MTTHSFRSLPPYRAARQIIPQGDAAASRWILGEQPAFSAGSSCIIPIILCHGPKRPCRLPRFPLGQVVGDAGQ